MLHGKIKEFLQKTEGYVEMNKLTEVLTTKMLQIPWYSN